jgi:hypothetical protein
MSRSSRTRRLIATMVTVLLTASDAFASQGPGTLPGTVSASIQMMMAIVVYGLCAAAIAAGAIGAFRRG